MGADLNFLETGEGASIEQLSFIGIMAILIFNLANAAAIVHILTEYPTPANHESPCPFYRSLFGRSLCLPLGFVLFPAF
jgi:hypothetical protein